MRIESTSNGLRIRLKVVPGSSRDALAGWLDDRLKIRVAAPPEQGQANAAVCRLLAGALGISRRQVQIVSGHTSPEKTAEVQGLTADQAAALLPG